MTFQIRKNLTYSHWDAFFYSLMVGFAESYFAAYLIYKGHSSVASGLIVSLPLITGSVMQLSSPFFVIRLKSYKKWILIVASLQSAALFALAATTRISDFSIIGTFILVSLYWGVSLSAGPSWNAWMSHIVPVRLRTSFFAKRSMNGHLGVLIGLICGGWLIQEFTDATFRGQGFLFIFLIASLLRIFSSICLSRQSETQIDPQFLKEISLSNSIKYIHTEGPKKLFIYLLIFQFSISVASGYFTPYMLRELKLSAHHYTWLLALALVARVAVMPLIRYWIATVGAYRFLFVATLGIAPIPWLWGISSNLVYLSALQILSGVSWAIFEIVTFLLLFNGLPMQKKAGVLAVFNLMQTVAVVGGSLFGAFLMWIGERNGQTYFWLFLISGVLRFMSLFFLPQVRLSSRQLREWVFLRPLGAISRPIIVRTRAWRERKTNRL